MATHTAVGDAAESLCGPRDVLGCRSFDEIRSSLMTLLIGSFEGVKVRAQLVLYGHDDFVGQWVSLDGLCRFFESLEIVELRTDI